MNPEPKDLGEFFRTRKIGFCRCLEPTMQCSEPAIRAHSIQNRQSISLLEHDNHVIAWQPRFSLAGADIALRRIGRNDASTFEGFCNQHDTELFRPLDTKPFNGADCEQLFLLAYRGITCEMHAIMTGVLQLQNLYTNRIERGLESSDYSSSAGHKATEQILLSWQTWRYRHQYYDKPLLCQSFDSIEHNVIYFNDQEPCFAASSFITLKDVPVDQALVGVAINILPVSDTSTVAVFSYAKQDQGIVHTTLDRILRSSGDVQKYELSKLVLSICDKWAEEKTKRVTDAFVQAVLTQQDVGEDIDFMLF